MVLLSKDEAPDNRGDRQLFDGNPFMTLQVVIQKDFVLMATFDNEEMVRRFSLDNDDARNNKSLPHRVVANRENIE